MKRGLSLKVLSYGLGGLLAVVMGMPAMTSDVQAATQTSGAKSLTLSVKKSIAYIHGTVQVPSGTLLMVHILSNGKDKIHWLTTVGAHDTVSTQNDISWLPDGKNLVQADVYEVSNKPEVGEKSLLGIATNSVSAVIHHQDLGLDVRRFYKPESPTYALADFVYIDHWNNQDAEFDWYDVMSGQDDTYFYPSLGENNFWYVTDGVAEYHLQMTSSTTATIQTRLLVSVVTPPSQQPYYEVDVSPPGLCYCTFKLTKVGGAWLINNIKAIENTLISASIRTS